MNPSPCFKCTKRTATCHADCDEYNEFKQYREKISNEKKNDQRYKATSNAVAYNHCAKVLQGRSHRKGWF